MEKCIDERTKDMEEIWGTLNPLPVIGYHEDHIDPEKIRKTYRLGIFIAYLIRVTLFTGAVGTPKNQLLLISAPQLGTQAYTLFS